MTRGDARRRRRRRRPVAIAGTDLAPHQRDRLAHLLALEEAGRAPHDVGDASRRERLLERLGLGVDAEQHGHLSQRDPGVAQPDHLVGDRTGLLDLVGGLAPGQLGPGRALGPQLHVGARDRPPLARLAGEQPVGGVDHLRGRAVVAHQLDGGVGGEGRGEVDEVGGPGAGEGVDRLCRVAHDADLVTPAEPQLEQRPLDRADVLELVDHEPLVLPAHLGSDPLVLAQQRGGAEQDVLHVHPTLVALELLVAAEHPRHRGRVEPAHLAASPGGDPLVVVGPDVADLGPLDLAREVAQQRLVDLDPVAAGRARDDGDLRLGQLGRRPAVHLGPEVADLPERGRVERARLHRARTHGAQAGAHLARRAGGEGDGEDLERVVDTAGHAVGDPVGDRPGLAGAGAREDPHRPPQRGCDLALLGVEGLEEVVGPRDRADVALHRRNVLRLTCVDRRQPP